MGPTREANMPRRMRKSPAIPHARDTTEYFAPTENADIRFEVDVRWPEALPAAMIDRNLDPEDDPTPSAHLIISSKLGNGRIEVPANQAHQLLNTTVFGLGTGAMVALSVTFLKFADGPAVLRLGICALCVAAIGGLTAMTIRRHRG